jgi:glyoxylase-like metal-dependent hydrolase (beta-lactamase superfamily II)
LGETAFIPGIEPTALLHHGQIIDLGNRRLEVLEVPGHCEGLIALWDAENATLFGTDAVYAGPLYAQQPDSDLDKYLNSLTLLSNLRPAPRIVYPAHGESPMSPDLIPAMRDAMADVVAGHEPDAIQDGVATYAFPGFEILARWPLAGAPS